MFNDVVKSITNDWNNHLELEQKIITLKMQELEVLSLITFHFYNFLCEKKEEDINQEFMNNLENVYNKLNSL